MVADKVKSKIEITGKRIEKFQFKMATFDDTLGVGDYYTHKLFFYRLSTS